MLIIDADQKIPCGTCGAMNTGYTDAVRSSSPDGKNPLRELTPWVRIPRLKENRVIC
jgi:cytochrome c peroxidase